MCGRFELKTKFDKLPKVLKKNYPSGLETKYETQNLITPTISESLKVETLTTLSPVIALVFGQSGLKVGATLEGSKYTKLRF